jgi:bacterioferritin-associated ferredoxin
MSEKDLLDKKIICSCTGTTDVKIRRLIDNGKDNLDDIASATGASTGCGSCDVTILEIIAEEKLN